MRARVRFNLTSAIYFTMTDWLGLDVKIFFSKTCGRSTHLEASFFSFCDNSKEHHFRIACICELFDIFVSIFQ